MHQVNWPSVTNYKCLYIDWCEVHITQNWDPKTKYTKKCWRLTGIDQKQRKVLLRHRWNALNKIFLPKIYWTLPTEKKQAEQRTQKCILFNCTQYNLPLSECLIRIEARMKNTISIFWLICMMTTISQTTNTRSTERTYRGHMMLKTFWRFPKRRELVCRIFLTLNFFFSPP